MNEPRPYFPVATIEPARGAAPEKYEGRHPSERGYRFGVVYVLEDGRRIDGTSHHRLLREAKTELSGLPAAPKYPTAVSLDEAGELVMVRTSYRIGG